MVDCDHEVTRESYYVNGTFMGAICNKCGVNVKPVYEPNHRLIDAIVNHDRTTLEELFQVKKWVTVYKPLSIPEN